MKGHRFYIQFSDAKSKRKNENGVNCLAVYTENKPYISRSAWCYDALVSVPVEPVPNTTQLCHSPISCDYLREKCRRISEEKARKIHSNLFKILDK